MKYRKKPIIVEAFQWTGGPERMDAPEWLADRIKAGKVFFEGDRDTGVKMRIETLEGTMRAELGDYIIRGIKGEIYPCKPDVFEATYEPVPARDDDAYFDRTEGQM